MADNIVIPDCGKNKLLELMLGLDLAENLQLKLFTNDATLAAATVASDLTEMDTHGYAAKTLAMASWGAPSVAAGMAGSSYAQQVFTATDDDDGTTTNVYGYYVVMATTGTLMWACEFGAPKPMTYENETISITPQLQFGQQSA